jgi:putative aminopeptidase FrvX
MDIKETFIKLTKKTYPAGREYQIPFLLPFEFSQDQFGNYFIQVGDAPSCMFTAHFDTYSRDQENVTHVFFEDLIRTDGKTILGADDKAGVTLMLYMIHCKVPGLYYFFIAEEIGCKGSKALAGLHTNNPLSNIKKVISFDRKGTDSVITFQSGFRCCSEAFAIELFTELNEKSKIENTIDLTFNYKADPTGICTDSKSFMEIYPECTNISIGYYKEHTHDEYQNILHLEKLAKTAVLIDWDNLGAYREPNRKERL